MAELVPPNGAVRASFLAAMAELRAEGRGALGDHSMVGSEIRTFGARWATPEGFAEYIAKLAADALGSADRPPGRVPSTTLWWVEGDEYLGRIGIRHELTEWLREVGGHIGYDVRPSARRQGHATAMLAAALPHAYRLGIDPALVTCDLDNVASRKVIEANGGVLEDRRNGKFRFWVPTGPRD